MRVNQGKRANTTAGNRQIIHCEGGENSSDVIFYRTILGANITQFDLQPLGSSNTLLCYAETELIKEGFCLIDRDFRTNEEIQKLENKYKIKFLPTHEIENLLLNPKYLKQLEYYRNGVDIEAEIENIISSKRVRFLADFLQFKINTHLDKFPRISKLSNSELPIESELKSVLLERLDTNYVEVQNKIAEIENQYIDEWLIQFNSLTINELGGKEIFKELKNKIFNNPPKESDIIKDIALLMEADGFIPPELQSIFIVDGQ